MGRRPSSNPPELPPIVQGGSGGGGSVDDGGGSLTVDGTVAATQSGTWTVTGAGGTFPVTGTFWQTTQPVSIASTVAVTQSGSWTLAANSGIDVGDVTINNGTGAGAVNIQDGGNTITVDGTVSAAQSGTWTLGANSGVDIGDVTINNAAGASAVNVQDGGNSLTVDAPVGTPVFVRLSDGSAAITSLAVTAAQGTATNLKAQAEAYQGGTAVGAANPLQVSLANTGANATSLNAASTAIAVTSSTTGVVSLGNSTGKAITCKTGNLATSANTADQVILTYTVTAGKTFYLCGWNVTARLTTYATTATNYGSASLETPSGTKQNTAMIANAGVIYPPYQQDFSEPMAIAAGAVIRVVCTPSGSTGFTWQANFWGYEK